MGIKAEHVNHCECTITPLPPKNFNQTTLQMRIDFCPLHAAAPELVAAAKAALEEFKEYRDSGLIVMDDHDETIAQLESAITKAEKDSDG